MTWLHGRRPLGHRIVADAPHGVRCRLATRLLGRALHFRPAAIASPSCLGLILSISEGVEFRRRRVVSKSTQKLVLKRGHRRATNRTKALHLSFRPPSLAKSTTTQASAGTLSLSHRKGCPNFGG